MVAGRATIAIGKSISAGFKTLSNSGRLTPGAGNRPGTHRLGLCEADELMAGWTAVVWTPISTLRSTSTLGWKFPGGEAGEHQFISFEISCLTFSLWRAAPLSSPYVEVDEGITSVDKSFSYAIRRQLRRRSSTNVHRRVFRSDVSHERP